MTRSTGSSRARSAIACTTCVVPVTSVVRYVAIRSRRPCSARARDVAQQQERRRVGPVQVVEDEHDRRCRAAACERAAHRVEEQIAGGRVVRRRGRSALGRQLRHDAREIGGVLAQDVVRQLAQGLDERLVGHERLRVAAAEQHGRPVVVCLAREARGQGGLPDARARRARSTSRPLTIERRGPRAAQPVELGRARHERACAGRARASAAGKRAFTATGLGRRAARRRRLAGAAAGRAARRPPGAGAVPSSSRSCVRRRS